MRVAGVSGGVMGFGLSDKTEWDGGDQEIDRDREEDAYLVAHRINGSLASILGNAQLLLFDLQSVASEPARRRLAAIRDEARWAREELLRLMDWKDQR
jgi:signal transduction histidine kinase